MTTLTVEMASLSTLLGQRHHLLSERKGPALTFQAGVLVWADSVDCPLSLMPFLGHNFAIWQSLANGHSFSHSPKCTGNQAQRQRGGQCYCFLCNRTKGSPSWVVAESSPVSRQLHQCHEENSTWTRICRPISATLFPCSELLEIRAPILDKGHDLFHRRLTKSIVAKCGTSTQVSESFLQLLNSVM